MEELQAKLAEMRQEDEGATLRILQLERERDNALALARHVHERHQSEHHQQEAQRQMYERYLQVSEHEIRLQQVQAQELRDEAAQAILQIGQQSQGEMFDMAKEYERITQMIHQKAVENSALRADLRLAEQLMMDTKEEVEMSKNQEIFLATENRQTKQSVKMEEQYAKNVIQESRRIREIASEEVAAEKERFAQLEAHQRPILPSLHEEIVHLRSELHVQGSELRATKSELHAASARSSDWEHAGNSVGFPSTHVSHTPVTIVSPAGSNSKNGSNVETPDKNEENPFPAPMGPPMSFGPETSVAYGSGLVQSQNPPRSTFREFATGLLGGKSKDFVNWGMPWYSLEKTQTPGRPDVTERSATLPPVNPTSKDTRLEPPPGLNVTENQRSSSSTSRAAPPTPNTSYNQLLEELLRQQTGVAHGVPSATVPPVGTSGGNGPNQDNSGVNVGVESGNVQDKPGGDAQPNDSEEIRQLIAELARARKSEERMRKERNDWKGWAESFESELEESRKKGRKHDEPPSGSGPSGYGGGSSGPQGGAPGGGGDGGDGDGPGDGDDITNPGAWRPGRRDPNGYDPPNDPPGDPSGDGSGGTDPSSDKPRISR